MSQYKKVVSAGGNPGKSQESRVGRTVKLQKKLDKKLVPPQVVNPERAYRDYMDMTGNQNNERTKTVNTLSGYDRQRFPIRYE